MESINTSPNPQKATILLFRKLFSKQEYAGRSLTGQAVKGMARRPALEDKDGQINAILGNNVVAIVFDLEYQMYFYGFSIMWGLDHTSTTLLNFDCSLKRLIRQITSTD